MDLVKDSSVVNTRLFKGLRLAYDVNPKDVTLRWMGVRIEHLIVTQERQAKDFMKLVMSDVSLSDRLHKAFTDRGVPISHSVLGLEGEALDVHPFISKIQLLHWTF